MRTYPTIFSLLIVLVSSSIYAQPDFRPGFVVTTENDTLLGEIDYQSNISLSKQCVFRINESSDPAIYFPSDIIEYRFKNGRYFVSKSIDGHSLFLEYILQGIVNVYCQQKAGSTVYFLGKDGVGIRPLEYSEYIKYDSVRGIKYDYQSTKHKGVMYWYFDDAQNLYSTINNMDKPERKCLIDLAKNYHSQVCDGEKCIIYEKQLPVFRIGMEVSGGFQHYLFNNFKKNAFLQKGVSLYFNFPYYSEKVFIKIGFQHTKSEYLYQESNNLPVKNIVYNEAIFPVSVCYLAPKTYRLRPEINVGLNTPVYRTGLNVKLLQGLYLGIHAQIQFTPSETWFIFLPEKKYSITGLATLYYEF